MSEREPSLFNRILQSDLTYGIVGITVALNGDAAPMLAEEPTTAVTEIVDPGQVNQPLAALYGEVVLYGTAAMDTAGESMSEVYIFCRAGDLFRGLPVAGGRVGYGRLNDEMISPDIDLEEIPECERSLDVPLDRPDCYESSPVSQCAVRLAVSLTP